MEKVHCSLSIHVPCALITGTAMSLWSSAIWREAFHRSPDSWLFAGLALFFLVSFIGGVYLSAYTSLKYLRQKDCGKSVEN